MQFLKYVANDIRSRFHNDLSRIAIVFPNKRSGIFFDDYLLGPEDNVPVWAPTYMTLSDLFDQLSPLKKADDIKAVCKLFNIYQKYATEIHQKEGRDVDISLDFFYGWGEQLISDFSDIDRSLVNADSLFGLWSSAEQLEKMTEEEKKYLNPLIETFNNKGRIKETFNYLWNELHNIYKELNKELAKDGEAYNGARERKVIEGLTDGSIHLSDNIDKYIFVGFNMLVPTERAMLDYMKQKDCALFYWDYDQMYVDRNTTFTFGKSLRRNMEHFPNYLGAELFNNLRNCKGIDFVAAPTDYGQTQYMNSWLSRNLTEKERDTAVILCDETQLEPVIHNLPDQIHEVNVTKGFPLRHTQAYTEVFSFFDRINEETKERCNDDLLIQLSELLQQHAQDEIKNYDPNSWLGQLTAESYFQCFTMVNRVEQFVKEGLLNISLRTLSSLLKQLMGNLSIPFHGEPASGLQVLGVLETRNLDFKNILMLSVNDGIIPQMAADHSFIPYDLRKHFRIVTNDERSEVYAYNFFRALQRCKKVTLVYNESTDGEKHRGEMSRFMLQILTQTEIPVNFYSLKEQSDYTLWTDQGMNSEHAQQLMEGRKLCLSPSALNTYLACPQKFFLSKILKLQELKKPTDILAANTFGSIFHRAAELIYQHFLKQDSIKEEELKALAENNLKLREFLEKAFIDVSHEDANNGSDNNKDNPLELLYKIEDHELEATVLTSYIKNLLKFDANQARNNGLKMIATEQKVRYQLDTLTTLNGIIDRVDETTLNNTKTKRIVDYKTGTFKESKMKTKSLATLFETDETDYITQTLFYNLIFQGNCKECTTPALYFSRKLSKESFVPYLEIGDEGVSQEEKVNQFKELLKEQINKIRTDAFSQTEKKHHCEFCPYQIICGRQ